MKKVLAVVMTGIMLLSLGACGVADFDAKGYVQAVLDAKFHGEYAEYAKLIGVTEEEAKKQMESEFKQSLEASMAEFDEQYGITDEQMAEYVQLEADIRAKVQYTVSDAVKDDDGNYKVTVQITPVLAYGNLYTLFSDKLTTAKQNGARENEYMGIFLESMKECVAAAETGEPVTFTFHVTGEESGKQIIYSVSEDETMNVDLIATGHPIE